MKQIVLVTVALFVSACEVVFSRPSADVNTLTDQNSTFLLIDGYNTHVVETGNPKGTPIILIHGFGGSTFSWRYQLDPLAEAGYRVIAYDRLGFGLSDKPTEFNYTMASQAQFLAQLMDELGVDSAVLVGHSQGANVASHFALLYPTRVQKLILVSAAINVDGGSILNPNVVLQGISTTLVSGAADAILDSPQASQTIGFILRNILNAGARESILRSAYAYPESVTDETIAGYEEAYLTENWELGLLAMLRDVGGAFDLATLSNISRLIWQADDTLSEEEFATLESVPVVLIWGKSDDWVPLETGQTLRELMPNAQWIAYDGVGHMVMEENPEGFTADLLHFLQEE
jgi:pimeloyl-ACP methyl ester carboxylesterase